MMKFYTVFDMYLRLNDQYQVMSIMLLLVDQLAQSV
jgi:hypothetical protein